MCEDQNKNIFLGLKLDDNGSAVVFQCKKCNSILGDSKTWSCVEEGVENVVTLKSKFCLLDYHSPCNSDKSRHFNTQWLVTVLHNHTNRKKVRKHVF